MSAQNEARRAARRDETSMSSSAGNGVEVTLRQEIEQRPDLASHVVTLFTLLCWAKAELYHHGHADLIETVDELQQISFAYSVWHCCNQDTIQSILAEAFRK